jgi:hypothetical protein
MVHVSKLSPIVARLNTNCLAISRPERKVLSLRREKFVQPKIFVGLPSASAIITAIY